MFGWSTDKIIKTLQMLPSSNPIVIDLLKVAFDNKNLTLDAYPMYFFLYQSMHYFVKIKDNCYGKENSYDFDHVFHLALRPAIYDNITLAKLKALKVHALDDFDNFSVPCFVNELYRAFNSAYGVFAKPHTKKEGDMQKLLVKCMSNLYSEYNVPLTKPHKSHVSTSAAPKESAWFEDSTASSGKSRQSKTKSTKSASPKATKAVKAVPSKPSKATKSVKASKSVPAKASKPSKSAKSVSADLTVVVLRKKAADCNIVGRSKMVKAELIRAIKSC